MRLTLARNVEKKNEYRKTEIQHKDYSGNLKERVHCVNIIGKFVFISRHLDALFVF